jgi:Tfp pilus assembly protein PilZ
MRRPLDLVFEDRDALRRALEGDLAKGGAFVPTDDPPPLQARVVIALQLGFARERVLLDADVVHVVSPESAPSPDAVGVGVQFLEPVEKLLARLRNLLGDDAPKKPATAVPRPEPAGGDLFDGDDLFDAPAPEAEVELSDGELSALLEGEGPAEADPAAATEVSAAESSDPFGWFDPSAREIDPAAAGEPEPFEGPAPGDPSFDPREVSLEAEDEPLPDLGQPGTGHRVRQD